MDNKSEIPIDIRINTIFENMPYSEKYGYDIWLTISIFILVFGIILYYFILNTIKKQRTNWEANKCNPLLMPFASTINSQYLSDNPTFDSDNFQQCLNKYNKSITDEIRNPIDHIFSMFSYIFKTGSSIASNIMSYIVYLFNLILKIFLSFLNRLKLIIEENNIIFGSIINFIGHIYGLLAVFYYKLILLIDLVKYIFIIAVLSVMIGLVLPSITLFIASLIMFIVFAVLCNIPFMWSFCGGAITFGIINYIALAFMILILVLYFKFSLFAEDTVDKIAGAADASSAANTATSAATSGATTEE
jgi:hypothetical protein